MEASKKTTTSSSSSLNGRNRINHPVPWLNLMVTEPFYLLHLLIFFSYFVARSSTNLPTDHSHRLFRREIQVVLMISVLAAVKSHREEIHQFTKYPSYEFSHLVCKMVKEETWDAFVADILFYAKCFLLGVALTIDYHLALYYLLAFTVIYVLTQQPPYDGLGDSSQLTPLQLESLLTEGNTSRLWLAFTLMSDGGFRIFWENRFLFNTFLYRLALITASHQWLRYSEQAKFTGWQVEFRALYSPTCIRTSSIFPELSITYSNKNMSFGIIDLGHFPNAAEKFGISLNGQLPTYILFDGASEVARLPDISSELKAQMPTITKHLLCQHFELDRRLIEYISSK